MLPWIRRVIVTIVTSVPSLLIFAALGGLLYWGHSTHWAIPKFSSIVDLDPSDDDDKEKNGEKKQPPTLVEKPEKPGAWCDRHSTPDEQCVACHPELATRTATEAELHPLTLRLESTREATHDPKSCPLLRSTIRFANEGIVARAGLTLESVREVTWPTTIVVNGTLEYPSGQSARVSAPVSGTVTRVFLRPGDRVEVGDVVALVDAIEAGKARSDWLQAVVALESRLRQREALRTATASDKAIREAEEAIRDAKVHVFTCRQALANLGLSIPETPPTNQSIESLMAGLPTLGLPSKAIQLIPRDPNANLIAILAPIAGVVTSSDAVAGEQVNGRTPFAMIADPSKLMVDLDVPSSLAVGLAPKMMVDFQVDGDPGASASGQIVWVAPTVDEKSRTLAVHADVPNPLGRLKAKSFGTATITTRTRPKVLVVPVEAVQWEGCSNVVFVRVNDKEFRTRRVTVGERRGNLVEVAGVAAGEVVVAGGSHVLKSELWKDRLGAGDD